MPASEQLYDLHFPAGGLDLSRAAMRQPWRQGPPGIGGAPTRIYTAAVAENVRSFEPATGRRRGGSRLGLARYNTSPVVAGWIIQELRQVIGAGYNDPTTGMPSQGSLSARIVNLIAVSKGNVYVCSPGDTTWTTPTNSSSTTPALNFSGIIFSDSNNQNQYFVDGTHYRYYSPSANEVRDWTLTEGVAMPAGPSGALARLIRTFRGRTFLAGIEDDSQNWYASAVRDATNWDYFPTSITPTCAVNGSNSRMGLIGDVVNCMIAYSDDEMLFGGDSSIYIMRGDPNMGGEIDLVTNTVGMAWGEPFCQDPAGNLYFMANTGGIYMMSDRSGPEEISIPIRKKVQDIDTGANIIRLLWDDRGKGLHVFVTPTDGAADTTHFYWESMAIGANAWFTDTFANKRHNPIACCTVDGNLPGDRVPVIGSWDGFVRCFHPDATSDDGTPIESEVWIGPLLTKDFDEVMLKNLQGILGASSGQVSYSIHVGRTPEAALEAAGITPGTFAAGRNKTDLVRRRGHAIFIRLFSTNRWALEGIRAALSPNMSRVLRRA